MTLDLEQIKEIIPHRNPFLLIDEVTELDPGVSVTAKKVVNTINIDKNAVDIDDLTMLEDLIIAALNDAYEKADKLCAEKLGAYAGLGL